ncbi:carboxylesterase/lipase family protein [Acidobacterium sp. S8]|uniref:carboxylesterase/lipase family protein n=1 Tax=Acidobacterium sp. S8 TaxID=1641854 RepID=UPI0020B16AA7|nr:carboxylesterase/lipase family protein [Acidobacterium sp. S8]
MLKSAVCVALAAASAALFAADGPTVKTDKGKVQGAVSTDGLIRIFKGIPYAAPPIGLLRWTPPQPAAKWHGTKEATGFGSRCMQLPVYDDMVFRDPGISEDCLTLNVWTPAKDKKAKLPVMVWIYGGGFAGGTTSEPRQDGENLAHKGVIVVSMNYRLGIFGFFVHPELTAESPHHASGNYGLMDQTAALRWVHQNIKNFGGDPNNVTLFGESAGSFSVSAQMASPLAQGLFVRAIGESGGAFSTTLPFGSREEREQSDQEAVGKSLGTTKLADLRAMTSAQIIKAAMPQADGSRVRFGPDVDGYFLPESVPAIYAAGKQAHLPLIAGWNADEGGIPQKTLTVAEFHETAQKDFGDQADKFVSAYGVTTDDEALAAAKDYAGARFIAYSTWKWLDAHVATGGQPVYRYHFELPSPGDKFHTAGTTFHSDDIEYVFGNLDSRQGMVVRPEDRKMSEIMQTYWTNFAKTGDPNGGELPKWPTYNPAGNWQVMHLAIPPEARPDTQRARYEFLQQAWQKAGQ